MLCEMQSVSSRIWFLVMGLETAGVPQIDQHGITLPSGCGTREQKMFGGICDRVVNPAGIPLVSSSVCSCFGAAAPWA